MSSSETDDAAPEAIGVGQRLLTARKAAGLSRADIAARTKIAERHLAAIEEGRFSALASRTYAVGFSRSYARAVGLDDKEIAATLRAELGMDEAGRSAEPGSFEPGDPARVPGASLAWLSGIAALLLVVGGYFFWKERYSPALELPSLTEPQAAETASAKPVAAPQVAPTPAPTDGAVTFTALESGIWVKFYDGTGRQLLQKQMALNESYTVPPGTNNPMVWTGRPEMLAISIGGQAVPKLSEVQKTMKDVPVTVQALMARPPAPPTPPVATATTSGASPTNSTTLP